MRAHKKFDGSTGLLDVDFIFMFRVTDFRTGDKDGDSDGTLFQTNGKTLSVCRWHLHNKCSFIYKANWKRN